MPASSKATWRMAMAFFMGPSKHSLRRHCARERPVLLTISDARLTVRDTRRSGSHDARPAAAAGIARPVQSAVPIAARGMDAAEEEIARRPGLRLRAERA